MMKIRNIVLLLMVLFIVSYPVLADEIKFGFKNPSFSGVGTGNHYLTIDNIEHTRKKAIEDALEAARRAAEREEDNSVLAKFIRNLESRIYAQLSRQLVDSLFGETASDFGVLELEGNTIEYKVEDDKVTLIITDEEGNTTEITVPLGSFTF